MARSSSKTRQNRPSNSNTTSEDIEMNSHDNASTSAHEKTNGDNLSSSKKKAKDTESSIRDAPAASSSSSKRVSTARPLSKQTGASAAGNVSSPDKADNGNSDGAESRKRSETKRYEDVEGLRADLKTASDEAKHWKAEATRHRKKNDDLLEQIETQGDIQGLRDRITDLELLLEQKDAQMEKLTHQAALVSRLTRDKKPSELKYITHSVAAEDRRGVEGEVKRLEKLLEDANAAKEQAEEEKKAQKIEYEQNMASLNTTVADLQNDLKLEIARQQQINKPASRTGKGSSAVDETQEMITQIYQDLTNFLVRSGKTEIDPDTGKLRWVFQCMCTGARNEDGNGRSLNFQLLLSNNPEDTLDENNLNQCKFIPLDLEKEPDEAAFRAQLEFLHEPFTFARDQMDIFFGALSDRLKPPPGPDDGADEANQSTQDMAVDSVAVVE